MIHAALGATARHGRLFLVAGLAAGFLSPGLAAAIRPWLPELVALLLFLSAMRIGHAAALGGLSDLKVNMLAALLLQLGLPLLAISGFWALGVLGLPWAFVLALLVSAPSVTGSPNFLILMGQDPAPALRLLALGTAAFPLTVLPVLWLAPELDDAGAVAIAALRLTAVVGLSILGGFLARHLLFPRQTARQRDSVDGASILALSVIVVGLMSALGDAVRSDPLVLPFWMGLAFLANFGLQVSTHALLWSLGAPRSRVAISVISGNRNIALFLVALPPEIVEPLLVFIGCYQVPMYLTPLLLGWFHNRLSPPDAAP